MNHDYSHCAGFSPDCPKKCFRAQLVRDLKLHITDILWYTARIPMSIRRGTKRRTSTMFWIHCRPHSLKIIRS